MEIFDFNSYKKSCLTGKTALITGASSGIGYSTACALASLGINLKLTARREKELNTLKNKLEKIYHIKVDTLATDISEPNSINKLNDSGFFLTDILINNAGIAIGKDNIENGSFSEWEQMINVNITSAFKVAKKAIENMKEKKEGDIIILSSIAAHVSYPGGGIYTATKHAVRSFANCLRKETCGSNIRIIQVSPGMVKTEFSEKRFKNDKKKADSIYAGMKPLSPNDIAYQIASALLMPRHVCLDEIIIMAEAQGGVSIVKRDLSD